ncbi:hypothetical protein HK405_016015, partial [Cladochytrium tenue]
MDRVKDANDIMLRLTSMRTQLSNVCRFAKWMSAKGFLDPAKMDRIEAKSLPEGEHTVQFLDSAINVITYEFGLDDEELRLARHFSTTNSATFTLILKKCMDYGVKDSNEHAKTYDVYPSLRVVMEKFANDNLGEFGDRFNDPSEAVKIFRYIGAVGFRSYHLAVFSALAECEEFVRFVLDRNNFDDTVKKLTGVVQGYDARAALLHSVVAAEKVIREVLNPERGKNDEFKVTSQELREQLPLPEKVEG